MPGLGREQYDLVLVFFYLQRELFSALTSALKPGGMLLYKTYTTHQQRFGGGPSNPMFLLKANELLHAFRVFASASLPRNGSFAGCG